MSGPAWFAAAQEKALQVRRKERRAAAVREKGDEKSEVEAFEYKLAAWWCLIVRRLSGRRRSTSGRKEAEAPAERVQSAAGRPTAISVDTETPGSAMS